MRTPTASEVFTTVRNSLGTGAEALACVLCVALTLAACATVCPAPRPGPDRIELPDLPPDCAHGTVLPPAPPRVRTVEAVVAYANRAIEAYKDNTWELSTCARHYRALMDWAELVTRQNNQNTIR